MLEGKVALITGGATGIGRAIALRLAKEGADIALNYSRSEQDARATQSEILALGSRCSVFPANVAIDQEVRQMVQGVRREFGHLDVLVNSAGMTHFIEHSDLEGMKDEYWDDIINVNVKGLFHCCRAAADELRRQHGCIVNITSIAGITGLGSSIAYAASKAAAISVTKSLARVMAPEVRVNSVAPGIVKTRWVNGQDEHIKRLAEGTPLGGVATPEDVAEVAFSLIANARFITGQNVIVDGGMFI
ncbi:MAG: SDR family NAD(P)-dependent oxidoreductase [Desulfitobacteriaceae bacterium]